jgi:hypothetical protein
MLMEGRAVRFPARFVTENLIWSIDGPVWAMWRLDPVSYTYLVATEKLRLFHQVRGALTALPAESMILSVCREIDPDSVSERMLWGVDLDRWPAWRDHVGQTLDQLEQQLIYDRYFYLAVALPDDGRRFGSSAAAATSWFGTLVGLTPAPPTRGDLDQRRRQAAQFEGQLSNGLRLRPVTPAEVRWLYTRAPLRGLVEPPLDEDWTPDPVTVGTGPAADLLGPSLVHVVDASFQEGGSPDDPSRPRRRRYVRVETEIGVSYQTFLVMASMPHVWRFPGGGGEWFLAADQAPFPVDWCARITSVPNQDAQLKSRRQARQLQAQVDEYAGEPSGPPASLQAAMESVDAERQELSASPSTPELRVTTIFALAAADLVDLELQAAQLRAGFEAWEYELPRPTGGQTALLRAMLPGSAAPPVARDYAQFLLPSGLASGMPIGGTRVGDPSGLLLGHTLDGGTNQPVLFDGAYGHRINRSGSLAAVGGLGAGKSHAIKLIAHAEIARGGRVVVLDRTASGEYVNFARAVPGQVQVVRLSDDADVCLDPLAVFSGTDRVRYANGFLALLCGTDPTDLAAATLAESVRAVAATPGGRLRDVAAELERTSVSGGGAHPAERNGSIAQRAEELAWKLASFAEGDLAQVAFGGGPAVDLYADFIVLWTPGLRLPDREQLTNEYLARRMSPEQVFSQALLYLVAAIARSVAFSDPGTFAAALFDEAWSLTSSPQGKALLLEGIRDGRKHNAAIWLLSQHPDDIDPQLAELLGNRLVFRQASGAAEKSLRFLGLEPVPEWVELVESGLAPGQCLYRDVRDRVGRIQVEPALTPELAAALNTNPAASLELLDDDFHSATQRPRSQREAAGR